ncbi:hypothetical protein AAFF_G00399620 [Aldrovandia affinis]|uniref:Coiled-coil domain-containing protein n=1 Tax=Aldrovandia affinis TaxID=143900 RepID=A0AAD7SD68_9TELE|nr:hypothetical protein AAFF_G00399620 [Aldrovandia affinis]
MWNVAQDAQGPSSFLRCISKEEQDSEYARRIQEEIQRCAEETRRREEEDEEMAKRLQEEEIDIRRQRLDSSHHGGTSDFPLIEERASVPDQPHPRQPVHASPSPSPSPSPRPSPTPSLSPDSSLSEEEIHLPPTSRGHSPVSNTGSDCEEEPLAPPRLSHAPQNNSAPQQAARQSDALRLIRNLLRESLGPAYNFDDEVFLRPPSMPAYKLQKRLNTAPSGHQRLDHHTQGGGSNSLHSNVRAGEREWEGRDESVTGSRRNRSRDERWRSNSCHGDLRWQEGRVEGYHRNEVRVQDRVYSWTYREDEGARQRHVHFQDERRRNNSYHGDSRRETATGSYQNNFEDRGVAARRSCRGDFRQERGSGSRSNHDERRSGEDTGHRLSQVLQRNVSARRSYHGDFRDRRRDSNRDDRRVRSEGSTQSEHRVNYRENLTIQEDRAYQQGDHRNGRPSQNHSAGHPGDQREWEGAGHGNRWGREEGGAGRDHHGERRVKRSASERWRAHEEPESSSQEEGGRRDERRCREGGRREERLQSDGVRHCVSFPPPPRAGRRGAGLAPRQDGACLELGELEQVLRDEELARVLQEDEERRLLAKGPPSSRGPQTSNPRGDFQAAQVAQDEEIARFMQRQERKAQRRPCDLGQGSRQEHRDPGDAHERRSTRERKVEVPRERLDSEGLNSPGEDLSPDCQPPSPNCTTSQPQATRNIAEELDPTFQAKRRDSNPAGQASSGLSTSPSSHSGLHDYTQEPTFVPPTKRQSDKSGRPKSKEKKESYSWNVSGGSSLLLGRFRMQVTSPHAIGCGGTGR